MADRNKNQRENDARQSSEADPALGQDERAFGAGGQVIVDTIDENDAPHRDSDRDPMVPGRERNPERSKR